MSFEALAWAWKQKTGSAGRKAVLSALAQFADEHGCCFPSQEHIAEYTEQSARTVREHMAWLEAHGYLRRTSRTRQDGTKTTDHIQLNLLKPAAEFSSGKRPASQRQISPAADFASGEKPHEPAAKIAAQEPVTITDEPSELNKKSARKTNRHRMPKNFQPTAQHTQYALQNGLNLADELAKFVDYHAAKGSTFACWDAALRTWLRKACEYRGGGQVISLQSRRPAPAVHDMPRQYGKSGRL